jgi:hypothetical protein
MVMTEAPMPYKNRKTGLIIFGIAELGMGALLFLMVFAMLLGTAVAVHQVPRPGAPPPPPLSTMLLGGCMYGVAGVLLIALGVGSMLGRRWARDLSLVLGWIWLAFGVLTTVAMAVILPRVFDQMPAQPPQARAIAFGCVGVMAAIFGIMVPLALVLFYRSPHVRATSRALDPVTRWTDRAPLPVIGLTAYLAFSAVALASCSFYAVVALGETFITGPAAIAIYLVLALCHLALAVGVFRLNMVAWWLGIAYGVLVMAYCILVLPHVNFARLMEAMHVPQSPGTPDMSGMYQSPLFLGWAALFWLFYFGYFLVIRRYFRRPELAV